MCKKDTRKNGNIYHEIRNSKQADQLGRKLTNSSEENKSNNHEERAQHAQGCRDADHQVDDVDLVGGEHQLLHDEVVHNDDDRAGLRGERRGRGGVVGL
jgi:hypothetical protein